MNEPDFCISQRVYWEDTDAGGIVYYANYLKFFERARTEWLRSFGVSQEQLRQCQNMAFVVSQVSVNYLQPARLDDAIEVDVLVQAARAASLQLAQHVWRSDQAGGKRQLLCRGQVRIACVNATTMQPQRIPNDLLPHRLP